MQRCPIRIGRLVPNRHPAFRNPIDRLWTHSDRLGDRVFRTSLGNGDLYNVNLQRGNRSRVRRRRKCLPTACAAPPHRPTSVLTKSLHAFRLTMGTARPRGRPLRLRLTKLCIHALLIPTIHSDNHTQMCVLQIAEIGCISRPLLPLLMPSSLKYAFRHALKCAINA